MTTTTTCASCEKPLTEDQIAAYAIMHATDLSALGKQPDQKGPGQFHAVACCAACYTEPSSQPRKLKAHFCLPESRALFIALGTAGSSSEIGGV